MKIARIPFAAALALLAAAPAFAAVPAPPPPKPPAEGGADSGRDTSRSQSIAPSSDSKPTETPAPAAAPKSPEPDFGTWLDGLSPPGWLTDSGLPLWAWVPLAFLAFALLRGLLRRGDRRDLIGPPPHMRLGARANPPTPRRADPPQRG